jgi:hypothetical protein
MCASLDCEAELTDTDHDTAAMAAPLSVGTTDADGVVDGSEFC